MYKPRVIKLSEIKSVGDPSETFKRIALELSLIKNRINFIDEIVVRAGFVIDTLLGVEPNDVDLFYSLKKWEHKDWPGCKCEEIRLKLLDLELPIINSRKVDLGHILEGEIYFSPAEKVVGPFSHHIGVPAMVCVDDKGRLWGNDEALDCINGRRGEIQYNAWLQHAYFPYTPEDPYGNNFSAFYALQVFRELRMIFSKRYVSVGPNLKLMMENCLPVFDYILSNPDLKGYIKKKVIKKNSLMKLSDYREVLGIFKLGNISDILFKIALLI